LSLRYGKSISTLRRQFEAHVPATTPIECPLIPVPLVFDATFFGRSYGLLIFRAQGKNIHWMEIDGEKMSYIEAGLVHLKAQGWQFSSVTIDGRRGVIALIRKHFPHVPIQLCVFHQKAIIQRYTTTAPKTECGIAIRCLMANLLHLTQAEFTQKLAQIKATHSGFLKERNTLGQFKHRRLRAALRSLTTNQNYIFTSKNHPNLGIPNTTNSCDGSFAHWKAKIKIHRGLRADRRAKMIDSLLANS
jgi:hypothetical protein